MSTTSKPIDAQSPDQTDATAEALVEHVRDLKDRVSELEEEKRALEDRVARLEAEDRKAVHQAEQAEEAAAGAKDAAQAAVDMASEAKDSAADADEIVETAEEAKDIATDVWEETEKRGAVYKDLIGKVNTFETRLEEFESELELSEYNSTSKKDRVKRVIINYLGYKAYQSHKRSRKDNAPAVAGLAHGEVHEVADTHHIDISREYGYTIARELVEEKEFVRMKSGGERNTGKATKLKLRFEDLPSALQDRARELYRENNSGGD